MPIDVSDADLRLTYDTFKRCHGNTTAAARRLGIARSTMQNRLRIAHDRLGLDPAAVVASGRVNAWQTITKPIPQPGAVKRYLLTCAQSNTYVHEGFWENLLAYAAFHNAEILVSQFAYNKAAYGQKAVKPNKGPTHEDLSSLWFDEAFDPYVCNDRVELAPELVFCGEVNISPTAERPLSGFETYTARKSSIFPHAKVCLESVPAMHGQGAKLNYSTGTATIRNYIQRKAGFKADFHHTYGALLVEVDSNGNWWVRQLTATDDGSFYDLDCFVSKGVVEPGHDVEAINWGDIHETEMDPVVRRLNWAPGGILDTLHPRYQFMHDTIDFYARNHHETRNHLSMFKRHCTSRANVETELRATVDFIEQEASRPWVETVIVRSNHDDALDRWMLEGDYRTDPENAVFFLKCQLKNYTAIERAMPDYLLVEDVLTDLGLSPNVRFLRRDESFVICADSGGIECGMHGDLGPNGARGSPSALARLGRRANIGHTHSAWILNGLFVAGTCSLLSLDYNAGPSSWSHSHIVTYKNGKRAIITIWNGKWRA